MKRTAISLIVLITVVLLAASAIGQLDSPRENERVTLVKLADAYYPPLAREARVIGTVEVILNLRPDGSVVSSDAISGHPLLRETAEAIARASEFKCDRCAGETEHHVFIVFQLLAGECCGEQIPGIRAHDVNAPQVTDHPSGTRVVIQAEPGCICDPASTVGWIMVRSPRCLWLWKCAKQRQ